MIKGKDRKEGETLPEETKEKEAGARCKQRKGAALKEVLKKSCSLTE